MELTEQQRKFWTAIQMRRLLYDFEQLINNEEHREKMKTVPIPAKLEKYLQEEDGGEVDQSSTSIGKRRESNGTRGFSVDLLRKKIKLSLTF